MKSEWFDPQKSVATTNHKQPTKFPFSFYNTNRKKKKQKSSVSSEQRLLLT